MEDQVDVVEPVEMEITMAEPAEDGHLIRTENHWGSGDHSEAEDHQSSGGHGGIGTWTAFLAMTEQAWMDGFHSR
ncbi:hypothetical protein ABG768_013041, partial [Culter alburnus]